MVAKQIIQAAATAPPRKIISPKVRSLAKASLRLDGCIVRAFQMVEALADSEGASGGDNNVGDNGCSNHFGHRCDV